MPGLKMTSVMMQNSFLGNWLNGDRLLRVLQVSILHNYFDN